MGNIDTPRKDHKLKLDYAVKFDTDTGEISTTRYDRDIRKKLIGVKVGYQRLKPIIMFGGLYLNEQVNPLYLEYWE
ncbi:hypothetical protein OH214_06125 [Idiomarina abyssalis]|uniref:hypothetical protein n=1 Tax=Idiomarina abyssalis TaxID=86102 RepID=UPI002300CF7E|nr:hypothetical protein [Idiomarina abyssalis]MDA6066700.1 hypothetical protein [Idiomarina abyssalis]